MRSCSIFFISTQSTNLRMELIIQNRLKKKAITACLNIKTSSACLHSFVYCLLNLLWKYLKEKKPDCLFYVGQKKYELWFLLFMSSISGFDKEYWRRSINKQIVLIDIRNSIIVLKKSLFFLIYLRRKDEYMSYINVNWN